MSFVIEVNPEINDRYFQNSSIGLLERRLQGFFVFLDYFPAPGIRLTSQAKWSLKLKRLIESVENGPEVDSCEAFKIGDSFLFSFVVTILFVKIDVRVCIFPMFFKKINIHNVLILLVIVLDIFSKISEEILDFGPWGSP